MQVEMVIMSSLSGVAISAVKILLGFDCDRPRGDFIKTPSGNEMANAKVKSLESISDHLDRLKIPRTYFLCGQFLESMTEKFGKERIKNIFNPSNSLSEIADHTYSHNIFKPIPSRVDKVPITADVIAYEYKKNSEVFNAILGINNPARGLRAPLGYYNGLSDMSDVVNTIKSLGALYISSDLRDKNNSINPPLRNENGSLRQPYYYNNGLLEIPSHGLHDTAFGNQSKTPLSITPPSSLQEILIYYKQLIKDAVGLAKTFQVTYYLGLVMHPYNVSIYDSNEEFVDRFVEIALDKHVNVEFCMYQSVKDSL
jgi:peptidoglycan/xylan/chitin deacetylase (PgdA/CDA1 family)